MIVFQLYIFCSSGAHKMLPTDPFDMLITIESVTTHSSLWILDSVRELSLEVNKSNCVPTGGRICLKQPDNPDETAAVNLAVQKFFGQLAPREH